MTVNEKEIIDLVRDHKFEIIERYDMYETPEISDWFYYAEEFTLNVCLDYEDETQIVIVVYGVDKEDDFEQTDWDHVLLRKYMLIEELENL